MVDLINEIIDNEQDKLIKYFLIQILFQPETTK